MIICAIRVGGNLRVLGAKISVLRQKLVNICATCPFKAHPFLTISIRYFSEFGPNSNISVNIAIKLVQI